MDQIKKLHFIILFLCILSLILGICIVYQIHEKKWMSDDVPMSYFEDGHGVLHTGRLWV